MGEPDRHARGATVYDFVHPGHRLAVEWPVLELVHRRFVEALARRVGQRFRLALEGRAATTRRARFGDFAATVDGDALVHELSLGPLPGVALLCLDASLVPALVDGWFGGTPTARTRAVTADKPAEEGASGESTSAEGTSGEGTSGESTSEEGASEEGASEEGVSEEGASGEGRASGGGHGSGDANAPPAPPPMLSATERRALGHVLDAVTQALGESWSELAAFTPAVARSTTPARLARGGYGDVVIDCPFALCPGEEALSCRLIYPAAALEPFAERLAGEDHTHPVRDTGFRDALGGGLLGCELELRGVLAETRITLAELMALKPGDFIPLKDVENVSFRTRNTPLFEARVGNTNGRVSASLSGWHLPTRS